MREKRIGVMALGFSTARLFTIESEIRKKSLLMLGISMCFAFLTRMLNDTETYLERCFKCLWLLNCQKLNLN